MKFEALTENTLCLLQMQELYNNSVFVVYSLSCVQLCDPIETVSAVAPNENNPNTHLLMDKHMDVFKHMAYG